MVNFYTYLRLFLDDLDKSLILNDFEKYFKKPHQTIKRHLQNLVSNKILNCEKKDKFLFYRFNKENPLAYEYITICEKQKLFDFLDNNLFKRLYEYLSPYFISGSFLIFGSATTDKKYDDIDLLVLSDNKKIKKTINDFQKTYSIKIHLIQTLEHDLTAAFKKEILKKHIILNNHDYFVNLLYKNG